MYQILSYPIKKGQPTWPGNPAFSLEPHTSIAGGDTANTCIIHLFNHYGTHLDGPMHFYGKGIPLDQVPFGQFFFHKPLLLDIPKEPGAKLMPEDLIPHREDVKDADLLLIRTGFSKYRREKPDLYENNGPAVSSRLARYLQDNMSHLGPGPGFCVPCLLQRHKGWGSRPPDHAWHVPQPLYLHHRGC